MRFEINGPNKIEGKIKVSGSKNASLAILAGAILIKGKVILKNVPDLSDIREMFLILKSLGAEIDYDGYCLTIDTQNVDNFEPLAEPIRKIRGSINFLGSLLARFGQAIMPYPGGDVIGSRSIKVHLDALKSLGVEFEEDNLIKAKVKNQKGGIVRLRESSVTATQILIMRALACKSKVEIRLAAAEPSVNSLVKFLIKAGAKISGIGTPFLKIYPSKLVKNVVFEIPYDQIEAGTWLALAGASKGELLIENIPLNDFDSVLITAQEIGIPFEIKKNSILVKKNSKPLNAIKLQTGLFPKFPTDLQAPFGVLLTQAQGVSLIHDWLFESRFGYLLELNKMGANSEILDAHRAIIIGPTPLYGKEINSLDIRSGASLVIGAVIAQGKTIIYEAEKIYRGYEKIDEKLKNIGVDIKVIDKF